MLHPHSSQHPFFSLFSILLVSNILSITNPISYLPFLPVLIMLYRLHETFPPFDVSRVIFFTIPFFSLSLLIYNSFLDLSSLCFAGSLSSRCTNHTQSIHPPPYLASLSRTSIPTTTLDSDPPISQRCYPYHIHFLPLPLYFFWFLAHFYHTCFVLVYY